MARTPSRVLSPKQEAFVDGIMSGKTNNKAAVDAGYRDAEVVAKSQLVKFEIAQAREKITDLTTLKRVDVIDGIMDGIACARMQGDSANIIKGWTEVAKILGHYAPEVKTININMNQQRLRSKFEALSDDELLALQLAPRQDVEDVEAKAPTLN